MRNQHVGQSNWRPTRLVFVGDRIFRASDEVMLNVVG